MLTASPYTVPSNYSKFPFLKIPTLFPFLYCQLMTSFPTYFKECNLDDVNSINYLKFSPNLSTIISLLFFFFELIAKKKMCLCPQSRLLSKAIHSHSTLLITYLLPPSPGLVSRFQPFLLSLFCTEPCSTSLCPGEKLPWTLEPLNSPPYFHVLNIWPYMPLETLCNTENFSPEPT